MVTRCAPLPLWRDVSHSESLMEMKGHAEKVLAGKVRELLKAVANDSPTQMARLMNGVSPEATASRTDELGRKIESDRRMLGRWLAADALMDRSSRVRLIAAANVILQSRGEQPYSGDFLEVAEPDPIDEISRKLDLLLALLGPARRPIPDEESQAALDRLERREADGGLPDPDAQRSAEDGR